jgi:hypothetical protein
MRHQEAKTKQGDTSPIPSRTESNETETRWDEIRGGISFFTCKTKLYLDDHNLTKYILLVLILKVRKFL